MFRLNSAILIALHITGTLCYKNCGKNEIYSSCAPSNCPQTCAWYQQKCTLASSPDVAGCYCKPGYVKFKGDCRKASIVCCPNNEYYTDDGPNCQATCDKRRCDSDNGYSGCFCIHGYVRSLTGECIYKKSCIDSRCSRPNEKYRKCPQACEKTCRNPTAIGNCNTDKCQPRCMCRTGYVRDDNENCIKLKYCEGRKTSSENKCSTNERYSKCGKENTCQGNAPSNAKCTRGCFCVDGYVRDTATNICCRKSQCSNECSLQNEKYSLCGIDATCSTSATGTCTSGCFCQSDYVRKSGQCVEISTCSTCSASHTVYRNCGMDNYCSGSTSGTCSAGCFCENGYVRDHSNNCVLQSACTYDCPEKNEEYSACGKDATCLASATGGCHSGCFCKPGYVRKSGRCVLLSACSTCSKPNTVFSNCGVDNYCFGSGVDAGTSGCFCASGYVRDSSNNCVRQSACLYDCPAQNEEYSPCGKDATCSASATGGCISGCFCHLGYVRKAGRCVPLSDCSTCSKSHTIFSNCGIENYCSGSGTGACSSGCICANGYVKDKQTNNCIPQSTCPYDCSAQYEEYSSCGKDATCSTSATGTCTSGCFCQLGYVRKSGRCVKLTSCSTCATSNTVFSNCGLDNYCSGSGKGACSSGCFCNKGYVRDSSNSCVLQSTCPYDCPAENEKYSPCGKDATCSKSASGSCTSGCFCQIGYVRKSGRCIPLSDCSTCSKSHTVYSNCGSDNFCSGSGSSTCSSGCFCVSGYVRDSSNHCILENSCQYDCPGQNEEYSSCGIDATCSASATGSCYSGCFCKSGYYRKSGRCVRLSSCSTCYKAYTVFRICDVENYCSGSGTGDCCSGCFCATGYVRDSSNNCVVQSACPLDCSASGANQVYSTCGKDETCYASASSKCTSGCFCSPGYVRRGEDCIPLISCDTCVGIHMAYSNCGRDNHCSGSGTGSFSYGCFCTSGFVRDSSNNCVAQSSCIPDCSASGAHQEYRVCGKDSTCYSSATGRCSSGCFCISDFVRKGKECIPISTCSKCSVNMVYSNCGSNNYCSGSGTGDCTCGCFCASGYIRDSSDKCIPIADCIFDCGSVPHQTLSWYGADSTCSASATGPYTAGCFCKNGYVRSFGKCIPITSCSTCSGAFEAFSNCGITNTCSVSASGPCCAGCFCTKGYVRNSANLCVPPNNCPGSCSGANQYHSTCDIDSTCSQNSAGACTSGCFCNDGYVRSGGNCVPLETCSGCPASTPFSNCNYVVSCSGTATGSCTSGCFCTNGLVRDSSNKCVPSTTCPNYCSALGPNQAYSSFGADSTCSGPAFGTNASGCFCLIGYVRSGSSCIPLSSCSTCSKNAAYSNCDFVTSCSGTAKGSCTSGCFCKSGLVSSGGSCIPYTSCPNYCTKYGPNQVYSQCSIDSTCFACATGTCTQGCFCSTGYTRSTNGKCILLSNCYTCITPSIFSNCGAESTCASSTLPAFSAGCFCPSSTVRSANGSCVSVTSCFPCPAPSTYSNCGKQSTCTGPGTATSGAGPCTAGCFCPTNSALSGTTCIPTLSCSLGVS